MLVILVVNGACEADLPRLRVDGEEAAGIYEEAVAYWFLLEGHRGGYQEAGRTKDAQNTGGLEPGTRTLLNGE